MPYVRTIWHGKKILTSLRTDQQLTKYESLAIVHHFDDRGLMTQHFKAAYLKDDKVGLKLQLSKAPYSAWGPIDDGPVYVEGTWSADRENPLVEKLDKPYEKTARGRIALWSLKQDGQPYHAWRYENFWQQPVGKEFPNPPIEVVTLRPIQIDGRGHCTQDSFVRSITYSHLGQDLYLKTSTLEPMRAPEVQDQPFDTFF